MTSPLPAGQYGVVQSKEVTSDRVYQATRTKAFASLDLYSENAAGQIRFKVRTTDHGDESDLVIGVTDDHRTINLHLYPSGEVTANLA